VGTCWFKSSIAEKTAAYLITNIMKTKKEFGMGVKKGTKRKGKKKKSKVKSFSNVIQTGIRALKTRKPLDLMNATKVARKAFNKSIGRNKNILRFLVLLIYRKLVVFYLLYPF